MQPKSAPNLDDLRAQARLTFRYWPLYLMLRLREIEPHLSDMQRQALGVHTTGFDLREVIAAGLWTAGQAHEGAVAPLALQVPPDTTLYFDVQTGVQHVELEVLAEGQTGSWGVMLMRCPPAAHDTLRIAASKLDAWQRTHGAQAALDVARLWAALQGARALDWTSRDTVAPTTATELRGTQSLPPRTRKRGRGSFRDPR